MAACCIKAAIFIFLNPAVFLKIYLLFWFCFSCLLPAVYATGYDVKTSSIIDQPAIEVLGDYNGSWYVIGFEKPNHPDKPARFYILKYAAGFPTAKSSPVYPPFGEKTDYLKAAIVDKKISIFYSRTEHLPDRPNMVDSRDGYKQIPKILRQDYDAITLLPTGEPVVVFDELKEHFAASGIDIAQSEDKSKTAILIKHYFRQSKFKVLLIDNIKDAVSERSYEIKADKDLVNFRHMVVSNTGQIYLEAHTQLDPLHLSATNKTKPHYYFFSINATAHDEPQMIKISATNVGNPLSNDPTIACLNNGELLVSYDYYVNTVLKGITLTRYKPDLTISGTHNIVPDAKFITKAAPYQNNKTLGLDYLATIQLLPLQGSNFMLVTEFHRTTDNKDKVTGITTTLLERHYLITYRFDESMNVTAAHFIDKKQSAHNIGYAFSAQAYRQGNDVYLFHNEDCEADDEHGLALLSTRFPANGTEPVTQKIVRTSEDFFISLEHIYPGPDNRIMFTEEKIVDFSAEGRELKLFEVKVR